MQYRQIEFYTKHRLEYEITDIENEYFSRYIAWQNRIFLNLLGDWYHRRDKLECGPMLNVTVALPNIGGALCSTPQSLADAHY